MIPIKIFILFVISYTNTFADSRIINGKEVEPGTYKEVVNIRTGSSGCTATIIGPRVILTAAHCAKGGESSEFTVEGIKYSAKITQSSQYSSKDHDIALGVTANEIKGIEYATVINKVDVAKAGIGINLLGFGCTQPGGGGGNDGKLRIGSTAIVNFSGFDMVSRMSNGAALCYGDSGGPAFLVENGKNILLGVNSKGNIYDTNYNTRLDIKESQDFFQSFISSNNVEICGINKDCSKNPIDPPTCVLSANPQQITLGQSLTLAITTTGEVSATYINETLVPDKKLDITPDKVGTFNASGKVVGPGGEGNCSTSYVVENVSPNPPSCTLVALPNEIKLGESLTLELTSKNAKEAKIDGNKVDIPLGKMVITPETSGSFTALGEVEGDGGKATCSATYTVINGPQPPPELPNFALIPSYCGENKWNATEVKTVCLSILKKDTSMNSLRINTAVFIKYKSGAKEAMPIIMVKESALDRTKDEYTLYANGTITAADNLILDTRKATVTKIKTDFGEVPVAIEGRTKSGQYFMVDNLSVSNLIE